MFMWGWYVVTTKTPGRSYTDDVVYVAGPFTTSMEASRARNKLSVYPEFGSLQVLLLGTQVTSDF